MRASFDYAGARVFVVGGTSGINLGIAAAFAAAGAEVGVGSRSAGKVAAAVAALSAPGRPAFGAVFDVRDAAAVAEGIGGFAAAGGRIDVLVSGAAGNFPAAAHALSPNGFKSVVDIDVLGTWNVMKAAHPHLRRPGAAVISISAPQAQVAMALQAHACAAKAGVDMVTRCLALEWGREGVRVNSVIPGPIDGTEGMARLAPDAAARARVAAAVPLGRMGTAAEVAALCLFLGSAAASYVTGAVLTVDGGWSLALGGYAMTGGA
ncbi:MAG: SDR family oxidoreductase [Rhodobacteraceae bacterium]|jgi:NAD(P)-dependent dehydrogenase (short-subunit alcohol dehydrogenase family)|nr:SDR family oxidoreductase [Paracoccaceae bacterium]